MSFDLLNNGIKNLLQGLGYSESNEAIDFVNASSNEYGNTFILIPTKGEIADDSIVNQLDDRQSWRIEIAFNRSAQSDIVNRDIAVRSKDIILTTLDKPANWSSFATIIKYQSWELKEFPNYFILLVNLEVIDRLTY
jgi:hypothetical protein